MPPPIDVILNFASGSNDKEAAVQTITEVLASGGCEPRISIVSALEVGDAARRAVREGAGIVVAGGGDGTINTVASIVAESSAVLGVLPMGTLNHFAKD